jgi:hypothetical protein
MYRRRVTMTAAAVFAIGAAFAAQPTSLRADWGEREPRQRASWVPGANALMSAYEPGTPVLRPPR